MADVYGEQALLKEGLIPPQLMFGHVGYLLPCHGVSPKNDTYLHLYAGHIARGADGRWVALADRTQGPAGAGYAVENRVIAARILSQDFQRLHVERLAPFFITLRETLESLSPREGDNPRIVLLSPGPRSSTYFEDAYLARYLGYAVVEGGDLTVRRNEVFLKSLGGLLPVDVVLRRIPDAEADPLELKPDSTLGVAGLVQAVRRGRVAVANALGSGFLEAPALMALLPEICRKLRREELQLPSIPTWWCGRPNDLRYVDEHLEELIVRPAIFHRSAKPIFGWTLSKSELQELRSQLRARPEQYVAQSRIERSTAPVWNGSQLEPWRVGIRTFAVASPRGYCIMPGGLSRVSAGDDFLGESVSAGQSSKDVWVLSNRPVPPVTLLQNSRAVVELRRSVNDLPSRTADNLLWLGRYVERAEGLIRRLRSILIRMTNSEMPISIDAAATLACMYSESSVEALAESGVELTLQSLRETASGWAIEDRRPLGLAVTLREMSRIASSVRDRLSIDGWRLVNQIELTASRLRLENPSRLDGILSRLNELLNLLYAFSGLASESMTRGPGWRFLDIGRRVERGLMTLTLIRIAFSHFQEDSLPIMEAVLEIADSTMTYRYRYLASLQLAPLLDLILIDETNPRAVGFQLRSLAEHIRSLPGNGQPRLDQRVVFSAHALLRLCDVDGLSECDESGDRPALVKFVDEWSGNFRELAVDITNRYLTHTETPHRLGPFSEFEGSAI